MTDNPASLGGLIRERRETANLSQRELARRVGVVSNTIGNIERGYVKDPGSPIRPDRDTIANVAAVLGIDEQRMFDAYGVKGIRFTRFDVTGLSPTQVERVKGYIDCLREN